MRAARPTIVQIDEILGRAALTRRCAPPRGQSGNLGLAFEDREVTIARGNSKALLLDL
jgi:hypothetical protein